MIAQYNCLVILDNQRLITSTLTVENDLSYQWLEKYPYYMLTPTQIKGKLGKAHWRR